MTPMSPLPGAPISHYNAIVAAKDDPRRSRLQAKVAQVQTRYNLIQTSVANLAAVPPVVHPLRDKADYLHCYSSKVPPLDKLKADIRSHAPAGKHYCRYCCVNHSLATIDHYMPKEDFSELAVMSLNLVPCCYECNVLKGTSWLDINGDRTTINFYFDSLPKTQFLFAQVVMTPVPRVVFRLSANSSDYAGLEPVIRNHFDRLKLLRRFREASATDVSEKSELIKIHGVTFMQALLAAEAQAMESAHSVNYWKVPMLQAMASNRPFLQAL